MNKNARELKMKLLLAGVKQKDIAIRLNVTESLVSHVIAGRIKSAKVSKIIQEMIGEKI